MAKADEVTRQAFRINKRLDLCIQAIGQRIEKEAARMNRTQRALTQRSLRHGEGYKIATIVQHALSMWAEDIRAGEGVAWDTLRVCLLEYVNIVFVDEEGRLSQINPDQDTVDNLLLISSFLASYQPKIKMLKSRRRKNAINGRLVITLALVKLALEYGLKLPPLV
jgi:hypothetical protein